jgi:LPXTG-motif cell wall-anchored protein
VTYTVVMGERTTEVEVGAGSATLLEDILVDSVSGSLPISVLIGDELLASSTLDAESCVTEVRGIVEVRDEVATEDSSSTEAEVEVLNVSAESTDATLAQTGFSAILLAVLGLLGMLAGGGLLVGRRED